MIEYGVALSFGEDAKEARPLFGVVSHHRHVESALRRRVVRQQATLLKPAIADRDVLPARLRKQDGDRVAEDLDLLPRLQRHHRAQAEGGDLGSKIVREGSEVPGAKDAAAQHASPFEV